MSSCRSLPVSARKSALRMHLQKHQLFCSILTGGQKMNIKSLLLGSAAALIAVSGARAADAVVVAEPEPAEYVKICDVYGAGYFYIPGTETCLRIGGYVRYDIGVRRRRLVRWCSSLQPVRRPQGTGHLVQEHPLHAEDLDRPGNRTRHLEDLHRDPHQIRQQQRRLHNGYGRRTPRNAPLSTRASR